MTDKEIIIAIRAEIERLMNELIKEKEKGYSSDVDDACILELQNVLTFINSLQSERSASKFNVATHEALAKVEKKTLVFTDAKKGENTEEILAAMRGVDSVSDELKEFAEEWDESLYRSDAVIAGAKWHKQQMIKSAKLSGWVARDENGSLHLFEVEPSRIMHRWWDRDYHSTTLDKKDFPDLEWEDEPIYVKLAIIKEDKI